MAAPTVPLDVHPEDQETLARLATLQAMHDQILDLRTLLPQRLWDPILATIRASGGSKPRSREALFTHLKKTADDGFREMESFRTAWHSDAMQDLWEKTKVENFPQGTDTWRVNYRIPADQTKGTEQAASATTDRSSTAGEDVKEVVEKYRARYSTAKLEMSDAETMLPLTLKVSGMSFQIGKQMNNDMSEYHVEAKPGPKAPKAPELQQEIVKSVENRKTKGNLSELLDMLISYADVKSRACDKCQKIINNDLQFPVVRTKSGKSEQADPEETQWLAYHRACV